MHILTDMCAHTSMPTHYARAQARALTHVLTH